MLENELDEKQRMGEVCQRLKDEVRGTYCLHDLGCGDAFSLDLHSELSRQDRKTGSDNTIEKKQAPSEGLPMQNGANPSSSGSTSQHSNVVSSSTLIKSNPSPQGTPLHTTFSGTQNFTPSTRISALNMVGDLLRKVGVSSFICFPCMPHPHSSCMPHPPLLGSGIKIGFV